MILTEVCTMATDDTTAARGTVTMPPDSHAATVLPQVQQAERSFKATGALRIPNLLSTPNGFSDESWLQQLVPYADKTSSIAKAQAGEQ